MNHTLDTYLNLCTQVYDLSKPMAPADAYGVYRDYAERAKGPILEPMCGTGRFLLPLLEEGFDVHGFDASSHMLTVLQEKAEEKTLKPKVWQGFLENLNESTKYELIFIPSSSFGLITDLDTAQFCLKKIYDQLVEGGTFVFEAETLKSIPSQLGVWRASVWHRKDGKFIIANFLELPLEDKVKPMICKYELVDDNQIVKTEIEDFKVRLYEPNDLIQMLKEIGFQTIRMIKAFDKTKPPNAEDVEIIYECRK